MTMPKLPVVTLGQFAIHKANIVLEQDPTRSLDSLRLRLDFAVNDVENPSVRTTVARTLTMSRYELLRAEGGWVQFMVRRAVHDAVVHEVDEWLRIDGELLAEPHPELAPAKPRVDPFELLRVLRGKP